MSSHTPKSRCSLEKEMEAKIHLACFIIPLEEDKPDKHDVDKKKIIYYVDRKGLIFQTGNGNEEKNKKILNPI